MVFVQFLSFSFLTFVDNHPNLYNQLSGFKKPGAGGGSTSASSSSSSGVGSMDRSIYSLSSLSPRTPDSSRSVNFVEAANWPFIDDDDVSNSSSSDEEGATTASSSPKKKFYSHAYNSYYVRGQI